MIMKLWRFIVSNLDTMLAVILSVFAAILGFFGANQTNEPYLLSALAATLGILAYGSIRDRAARDSLRTEVSNLGEALRISQRRPNADHFFRARTSEMDLITQAREEVWLLQETGSKIIEENFKALESLINRGGQVRLLITTVDEDIVDLIALRAKSLKAEDIASRHKDALRKILALFEVTENSRGSFEVRRIRYPLDITATYVDPNSVDPQGRAGIVRTVGFQNFFDDKRDFPITFDMEPQTYQYFIDQFREMWRMSEEQNLLLEKQ